MKRRTRRMLVLGRTVQGAPRRDEARYDPPAQRRGRRHRRRLLVLLGAALALAILAGLWRWPAFVEQVYARRVGPLLVGGLSGLSGGLPFSLAELLLGLGALWLLLPALLALAAVLRRRQPPLEALTGEGLRVGAALGLGIALFYGLWGLNYARESLVARAGWSDVAVRDQAPDEATAELARLADELVRETNDRYLAVHGAEDAGRATRLADAAGGLPPQEAFLAVDRAIDAGYAEAASLVGAGPAFAGSRGPAKPVAASELMNRFQLAGFYFPFTGEANVNGRMPPAQLPHTIAHEKAHQRGIGSEDEANFLGFLAAIHAPEPLAAYSGYLFAQRQLLGELHARDPERAAALVAERLPGVQRDVDDANAHWARYEGRLADWQHEVNDTYLTLNGVEGGIDSYGRSAQLLVIWARANEGSVLAASPGAGPLAD